MSGEFEAPDVQIAEAPATPPAPPSAPPPAATNEYDTLIAQGPAAAAPAPAGNEYDGLVVNLAKERGQRLRAVGVAAQGSTPAAAAKSIDLSRKTGLPADVVERNLPKVEGEQKLNEYDALLTKSPKLADWLSADPVNAKVADSEGDFSKLSLVEEGLNELNRGLLGQQSNAAFAGWKVASRKLGELEGALQRQSRGEYLTPFDKAMIAQEPEIRDKMREAIIEYGGQHYARQSEAAELPLRPVVKEMQEAGKAGDWGGVFSALKKDPLGAIYSISLQSAVMLPWQIGGYMLGGPAGAFAVSFLAEYMGGVSDAMEEAGVNMQDPTQVTKAFADQALMDKVEKQAAIKASTIAAVDTASLRLARVPMGFGKNAVVKEATNIASQIGVQAVAGATGEAAGSTLAGMKVDPFAVVAEALGEAGSAPVEVMTTRWGHAVKQDATREQWEKFQALPPLEQDATGHAMAIDRLVATANDTKLAAIAPEKLQEFIKSISEQEQTVFVPADVVATYMQSLPTGQAEALAERLGITDQLARVARTGEDVAIPMAMYVTGAKDAHAAWREQIRTEVDGFSVKQAQEWEKAKAAEMQAIQDRFEEQLAAGVVDDPRTMVYQRVLAMAKANGYTNDVAAQHAALYAAHYHARAERNPGAYADALDAFQKAGTGKGMTIRTELAGMTRALGPDQLDIMLDSIRSGRDPATIKTKSGNAVPVSFKPDRGTLDIARRLSKGWGPEKHVAEPQSLTDFVRKNGGLNISSSEAGDLRAGDLGKIKGLLQKKKGAAGRSADLMAQAAKDAGFIFGDETQYGSGVDVNAFISALIADASNRTKSYPDDADTQAWIAQQDYFAQHDRWLKEGVEWEPKGREPIEIAWFLSQDAGAQRLMALREREHLGRDSSLEAAYLTDAERAKAETQPPSGDPGDIFRTRRQQLADAIASMGLDPAKMTNEQIRAAIDKEIEGLTLDQPVYHGGPHIFDRFDLSKVGSGEGAQAYGWGLYFAGKKQVAEWYRDKLSPAGPGAVEYNGKTIFTKDGKPLRARPEWLQDWGNDLQALIEVAVDGNMTLPQAITEVRAAAKQVGAIKRFLGYGFNERFLQALLDKGYSIGDVQKGRLYTVEIPDDGAYLLWDKPLSQQPESVKAALKALGHEIDDKTDGPSDGPFGGKGIFAPVTGGEWYNSVTHPRNGEMDPKSLSDMLRDEGVPGIKYLNGASRGKGAGDYNYVLFDATLAEIKSYEQPSRGSITFGDNGAIIRLFQGRDLSTLAHESGHLWLAELEFDVKHVGAGEQARADWQTVLDFVGSTDGYITREQHELFARAFETYLMEGKAPSEGLRAVFRSFKNWLVSIYRNLRALQAPISPEMRQVFDRLIATDEEIAGAQNAQAFNPVFADAKSAEMTEAEFKAYTKRVVQVVDEAEQKVLEKVMATIRRQRTKEVAAEKAKIRGEVKDELMADPGQAALHFLRNGALYAGETPEILKGRKLSRPALIALVGQEGLNALPMGTYAEDGISPDDLAQVFGLGNGLELVERLMQVQAEQVAMRAKGDNRAVINARIAEETQRRLTESLGDPLNDGSIEAEAMAAVHSDKQGALMASELKVLARKAGHSGAISLDDIKVWAANAIGEMSSYQATQFLKYQRAERLAGQKVQRALVKGDFMAAFRAKQDQLVNFALYTEAKKAADDTESVRKLADRYASAATIKNMDQEALEQIHQILEDFDFKKRSGKLLAERTTFNIWAAEQAEKGFEVIEPPRLKGAQSMHYSAMTMDELRGLGDTIKQIAHIGRWKQAMMDGEKKRQFETIVAEAIETAGKIPQRGVSLLRRGTTALQDKLGDAGSWARSADAALLKLETIFEWLDNDKTGRGVFSRIVFRRMADAQTRERDLQQDLNAKLKAIFDQVPKDQVKAWADQHVVVDLGTKLNKSQMIAVALNIGNASNLEKLLRGENWGETQVREMLNKYLTKEEWQLVQNTWDLINSLWPETEAMEKRINGVAPPKVEPIPVETPFGTLAGGYYPMSYDKHGDIKADRIANKGAVGLFDPEYRRASTRAGATHKRVENFNAKVQLSLSVIGAHLNEAAHDLAYREAVMDAYKFLSDDRVRVAIQQAIGVEYEKQMQPWLKNVANEWAIDRRGLDSVDKFLQVARTNVTMVGMGFRISTMLSQLAGFGNSIQRIGSRAMFSGMRDFYKHPKDMAEFVRSRSGEMKHRANDLERDIRAAMLKNEGKTGRLAQVRKFAFRGISLLDAAVSLPTWMGAYNQGMKQGMAEGDAVYFADKTVRDTQGAGAAKDLAAIQRGGEPLKLMTMFYSYFNVFYNRQRGIVRDARAVDSVGDGMDVIAQTFWLMIAPTLMAALLSGQGPDDDEELWAWALRNVGFGIFSGVPYGRDVANAMSNKIAGKSFGGPKLSPVQGIGEGALHLFTDVVHLMKGEDTSQSAVKNVFNFTGLMTGLPTGQLGATSQYVWDVLVAGTQNPDGLLEWLKGLTFGPEHKK